MVRARSNRPPRRGGGGPPHGSGRRPARGQAPAVEGAGAVRQRSVARPLPQPPGQLVPLPHFMGEDGASAVEFAMVTPVFLALVLGIINLSICLYGVVTLHFATEDAARCFSVNAVSCPDAASTVTYAQSRYAGPGFTGLAFAANNTGDCDTDSKGNADGHVVTASASYNLVIGFPKITIPISTSACFP
ncbi:MAG TPA: TadE family protein [Caulobacteraceae bacterium]|nr:TadE family protein [Caulobacteraceae bacterium]